MRRIQKAFVLFLLVLTMTLSVFSVAFAQPAGLLPGFTPKEQAEGEKTCASYKKGLDNPLDKEGTFKSQIQSVTNKNDEIRRLLACSIRLGKIHLFMLPYFIGYIVEFLLLIGGLIAVLFVVYGGYQYSIGGISEDKESGKKTIMNALIGVVVSLGAWIIVNFLMVSLTS